MTKGKALQTIAKNLIERFKLNESQSDKVSVSVDSESGVVRVSVTNSNAYTIKPNRVGMSAKVKMRPYSVARNYPNAVFNNADFCFYTMDGKYIGPAYVTIPRDEHDIYYSDELKSAKISTTNQEIDADTLISNLSKQLI